jgi:Concanavalin A-like lectin/glucanases superfamily
MGCKATEMGTTPEIPIVPSSIYSKKSLCFTGASSLQGIDAFQLIPDPAAALPVSDLTISFWIKMDSENPSGMIASMEFTNTYLRVSWVGSTIEYRTFANGTLNVINTQPLATSDWNHVVVNYDGFSAIPNLRKVIYVNGQIAAQSTAPIEYFPGTNQVLQFSPPSNYLSSGCVDDIYVWHRQLTANEVQTLYDNGKPKALTGTLTDIAAGWQAEQELDTLVLQDTLGVFNPLLENGTFIKSNLADPFANPDLNGDPLDSGAVGNGKDGSGSGSGPFEGGSDGYAGELGNSGPTGNGGLFP